jgi:tetratricopeptide (TPR) repeat protein
VLHLLGDHAAAMEHFERALALPLGASRAELISRAAVLNNLAAVLETSGDQQAARPHYEQALAVFQQALGDEHPTTRGLRIKLNSLTSGQLTPASLDVERELAALRSVLGVDHPWSGGRPGSAIWCMSWEGHSYPLLLALAA